MASNKALIRKLQIEKRKLMKLEQRQKQADEVVKKAILRRNKAKQDELKLKREISNLRKKTSKSLVGKIRRQATSPQAKAKARKALKKAKKGFSAFQKFANKYGT